MGQGFTKQVHSKNDFELVIKASKELEYFLETEFGAEGRGLHEKISSVSGVLTPQLVKDMRFLATIRNKLIHEVGFDTIPDRTAFIKVFERSVDTLNNICRARGTTNSSCIIS